MTDPIFFNPRAQVKLASPRHVRCHECGGEGTLTHVHPSLSHAAIETEVDDLYRHIHRKGCSRAV